MDDLGSRSRHDGPDSSPPDSAGVGSDRRRRSRSTNLYNPIMQALVRFTVRDLLLGASNKPPDLITIKSSETLEDCLRIMNENNIICLPVQDEDDVIVESVDLMDVMAFYADIFRKFRPNKSPDPTFRLVERRFRSKEIRFPGESRVREYGESLRPILENIWMDVCADHVMGYFRKNRCDFISQDCTIAEVAETLSTEKKHRALVLRNPGLVPPFRRHDVATVISQHDVAVFVRQIFYWALGAPTHATSPYHLELFSDKIPDLKSDIVEVMQTKIKDLGVGTEFDKPIISISIQASVIEAIKYLVQNSVSVVGATGSGGKLVDCFSGAALRHITPSDWDALVQTLFEFFGECGDPKSRFIIIDHASSLLAAIDRFTAPNAEIVHHIWISDEVERVVGVLSLTDLMRIAATYQLPGSTTKNMCNKIGILSITILLAENLPPSKSRFRVGRDVYAKVEYPFLKPVRTPVTSGQLSPSFRNATFQFPVTTRDIGKELVVSIMDKKRAWRMTDKLLGQAKFDIAWIVNSYRNGSDKDKHQDIMRSRMKKNGKETEQGIVIVRLNYNSDISDSD